MLTKARRELKLKADDIATELCLSVQQVQAIENNLNAFVHSTKLKQAVIKRYCRLLNIDVNSVNTNYELDETDTSFQEIKRDGLGKRFNKVYLPFNCSIYYDASLETFCIMLEKLKELSFRLKTRHFKFIERRKSLRFKHQVITHIKL